MRYDAAIIGAGANGLAAAALLTRAGLAVVLVERAAAAGGRLVTRSFHPGFSASVFADRIPEIPAELLTALDLDPPLVVENPPPDVRARRDGALARIFAEARQPMGQGLLARVRRAIAPTQSGGSWPGQDLAAQALSHWPQLAWWAQLGRALDPDLAGSAVALLALAGAEPASGGLGALGSVFAEAAGGAELILDQEVGEVALRGGRFGRRVSGIALGNGRHIQADAVISTLDFKRSVLSLFAWEALPESLGNAALRFRMGGGTARLLLALGRPPVASSPLLLPGDANVRAAFRRGAVPEQPPLLLDPVSARDPGLAPRGCATMTVTMAGIPARLFDGGWSQDKRNRLAAGALRRIEAALPGTLAGLAGVKVIVPPDIEAELAASEGDLDGGQLAPDQMLALRPGARTALAGFYLGGASAAAGPLGTGAAGYAAALSLLADRA